MTSEPLVEDAELEVVTEFRQALSSHSALPYLFLGSGMSRRYLDLPDWRGLLKKFSDDAALDFDYISASSDGDLPSIAAAVAKEFHEIWWKSSEFQGQREAYRSEVSEREDALKVAISSFLGHHGLLQQGVPGIDDENLSAEISILKEAVIDGVMTTNYDTLVEQVFPDFKPYVGQDGLLLSDAQFIAEIYKIHGSIERPSSLVLTTRDYENFKSRNHYLTAKLLTLFSEHPVIFAGYSLTDEYLQTILGDIVTAVGPDRIGQIANLIYFIEWNPSSSFKPIIERTSIQRGSVRLPITRIETHNFAWIWGVLSELERPFPAAILRELRRHVYDLVLNPDMDQKRESVIAVPIDSPAAAGQRIVFGVGSFTEEDLRGLSRMGRPLTRQEVELDLLGEGGEPLDPEFVLKVGIPQGIRPTSTEYVPVFKYLDALGRIDRSDGTMELSGLPPVIAELAAIDATSKIGPQSRARFEREVNGRYATPPDLVETNLPIYFQLDAAVLMDPANYPVGDLRDFLSQIRPKLENRHRSAFRRVLCHYDRLNFGP